MEHKKILVYGKKSNNSTDKKFVTAEDFEIPHGEDYKSAIIELQKIHRSQINGKDLHSKYKIPKGKKIVLFATGKLQPYYSSHGIYDYDVQIWKKLLDDLKEKDNVFLILKPHPMENNIEVYQNLIKQTGSTNSLIIKGDLIELLSLTSVTISVFSSVMIDSLCFEKPVIRLKFQDDFNPIFDPSSAILTSDLDSLTTNILKIIESEDSKNFILKDIRKFVKENYGIPEHNPELILRNLLE